MKTSNKLLSIGAAFTLMAAVLSCEKRDSSELAADEAVYQDYFVSYDMNTKKTSAAASLRDNNKTRLTLNRKGEKILFNKKLPKEAKSATGALVDAFRASITDYEYRWEVDKLIDGEFTYLKNKSKTFTNTIRLNEVEPIKIPASLGSVKLDGTTVLKWEGAAAGDKERIDISFEQNKTLYARGTGKNTPKGQKEVTLKGDLIKGLKKGKATLIVSRRKELTGLRQSDGKKDNGRRIIEVVVKKEVAIE